MIVPTQPAPTRVRRPLWTSAWVLVLVLVVVGFGFVASRSDPPAPTGPLRPEVAQAEQAIGTLLSPGTASTTIELLPADFTEVTGVVPAELTAPDNTIRAVHADGGCSTPWGDDGTRWDYTASCKAHDLGYDLLRYSAAKGQPLGPEVRKALDDRLSADMHAMCGINPQNSPGTCRAVASLFSAGLVINSWHQRWGPPVGEPVAPMLAGVAMIGFLLTFRLRGWLHARRIAPRQRQSVPAVVRHRAAGSWAPLAVAAVALLVLGESAVALGRWAGVGDGWLWPLTWLTQLAFLFFFAGGRANAAGWREIVGAGGGYREYLAHRAGWLLRPALVFAVVAFAVPMALELLGIPPNTTGTVMRIALHPLWLLGVYLLTVVVTPIMLTLHRRAPLAVLALIAGGVLGLATTASGAGPELLQYAGVIGLALLAQQLGFAHADGLLSRRLLGWTGAAAIGTLVALAGSGALPLLLLGTPGAVPPLAGPTLAVLLLGLAHLGLLLALPQPARALGARAAVVRVTDFALRAPMSLYLCFLTAMLLLITVVYLPEQLGRGLGWVLHPRSVIALAMLAGPGVVVFWWFERHTQPHRTPRLVPGPVNRLEILLARAAAWLGFGYAVIGIFGFALSGFSGSGNATLLGLELDPIQSVLHLLLGVSLLHTVRTGASGTPTTWVLSTLACVPPLLAATSGPDTDTLALLVHGVTGLFATAAVVATVATSWRPSRTPVRSGG
ncbi:phospholipase A2 [Amycolatopsis marina]|uniref:Phospholipase A2 n=1 Tax=Amycolatopsis marina TaxID=490629 RepID=A0A1I0YNE4_9PSEU|nr:phospholipase A2 [Amycolatopsis marina]SFB13643.1 phospholipase A2 [Amycolatopsis marina]